MGAECIAVNAYPQGGAFQLKHAILIYGEENNRSQGKGDLDGYVSIHDIQMLGKRPVLGPGVPATRDGLREMCWTLMPDSKPKPEFIPANILAQGPGFLVWWHPPSVKSLWFKCEELGGEVSGKVPLPGLVFVVAGTEWYIFAVKGSSRPVPDTPIFRSPFFNVWRGGRICTGSVAKPTGDMATRTEAWEHAFFDTWNTHPNIQAPEVLLKHKGGPYSFWRAMLGGKFKVFPEKVLVPEGPTATVGYLLSSITALMGRCHHG